MYYFMFAIFFAFNFSLWYMLPAFMLKSITPTKRKKKKDNFRQDIIRYVILTILYIIIYLLFYFIFKDAIDTSTMIGNDSTIYLTNDILLLGMLIISYLVVSIAYAYYTYHLAKKFFSLKDINTGYSICSVTGFFSILGYYFSNTILNINNCSFGTDHNILNTILKIDNEMLVFTFVLIVFLKFAYSFIEEE